MRRRTSLIWPIIGQLRFRGGQGGGQGGARRVRPDALPGAQQKREDVRSGNLRVDRWPAMDLGTFQPQSPHAALTSLHRPSRLPPYAGGQQAGGRGLAPDRVGGAVQEEAGRRRPRARQGVRRVVQSRQKVRARAPVQLGLLGGFLEHETRSPETTRDHTRDAREAEHCSSRGFVGGRAAGGASLRVDCPRAQVPGRGLGDEDGAARRKEERSLEALRRGAVSSVRDLEALHRFLFVEHGAYRAMEPGGGGGEGAGDRATGASARTY